MKLRSVGIGKHYCTPVDDTELPLFTHCTNGQLHCLKERVINGDVGNILLAHGVHSITMVDDKKLIKLGHTWIGNDICVTCGHSKKYAENNNVMCFNNELVSWISK
jgi:hypothetical protein